MKIEVQTRSLHEFRCIIFESDANLFIKILFDGIVDEKPTTLHYSESQLRLNSIKAIIVC